MSFFAGSELKAYFYNILDFGIILSAQAWILNFYGSWILNLYGSSSAEFVTQWLRNGSKLAFFKAKLYLAGTSVLLHIVSQYF